MFPLRERALFDEIARSYGIVGEDGSTRTPELARLLIVMGLTPSASAKTTAAVGARINIKMIVARFGNLLSKSFGGVSLTRPQGPPTRRATFYLDTTLWEQVMRFVPNTDDVYNGHGRIVAKRVVERLVFQGLHDQRLGAVLEAYAPCVNAFIERLARVEGEIHRALDSLIPAVEGAAA